MSSIDSVMQAGAYELLTTHGRLHLMRRSDCYVDVLGSGPQTASITDAVCDQQGDTTLRYGLLQKNARKSIVLYTCATGELTLKR